MKKIFGLFIMCASFNSLASQSYIPASILCVDDSIYDLADHNIKSEIYLTHEEEPISISVNLIACDLCYGSVYSVPSDEVKLIRIFNEEGQIIMTSSHLPEKDNYFEFEHRGKYKIELSLKDGTTSYKEITVFSDK